MKKINLTIKKVFLKFLLLSIVLSNASVLMLLHFGKIHNYGNISGYHYNNDILNIYHWTGIHNFPNEYSEKLAIYFNVLYSDAGITSILIGILIILIFIYLIKYVKIRVN